MSKFSNSEFEKLTVNFWLYSKAHRIGSPRLPPSFDKVLNQGGIDFDKDYPLNRFFPAFSVVLNGLEENDYLIFYSIYLSPIYLNEKKIPIKVLASKLGINRRNFYKKADSIANKVWKKTKDLTMTSLY
jgi:hypothetical protein